MTDVYCKYYIQAKYSDLPKCSLSECKLDICPMVYRCNTQYQWRPLKGMVTCYLIEEHERNMLMKDGKNIVRFVKNGQLYVELYDNDGKVSMVVTIPNPYNYEPQSVEVVKIKNNYYVKGYEPKEVKYTNQIKNKKYDKKINN